MPSRDQCLPWLHAPYCPKQSLIPQVEVVMQSGFCNACHMRINKTINYPENSHKVVWREYAQKCCKMQLVKIMPEKTQACMGFEPMTSTIPVQCSTN